VDVLRRLVSVRLRSHLACPRVNPLERGEEVRTAGEALARAAGQRPCHQSVE